MLTAAVAAAVDRHYSPSSGHQRNEDNRSPRTETQPLSMHGTGKSFRKRLSFGRVVTKARNSLFSLAGKTLIATPNEDTQLEDEVIKGRKGKGYATGYNISHSFVTNWTKSC